MTSVHVVPQDPALPVAGGALRLELGPSEIRTIQLRRGSDATGRVPFPDAAGPRQNP